MEIELNEVSQEINLDGGKSIVLHVIEDGEEYADVYISFFSSDFESYVCITKKDFSQFETYLEDFDNVDEYYFTLEGGGEQKSLTLLGYLDNYVYFEIGD